MAPVVKRRNSSSSIQLATSELLISTPSSIASAAPTETASKSTCGVLPLLPRLIPSGKATLSDSNVFSRARSYSDLR